MIMAEVDTSSYLKPSNPAPKSLMEQVQGYNTIAQQCQALTSGALTIENQKLELLKDRMGQFTKGLLQLSQDPTLDFNKINDYAKNQVKLGYMTPEVYANAMSTLPQQAPPQEYQARVKQFASQALQTHDAIQQAYGQNQDINQGNQVATGVRASPMAGGGFKQTGTFYEQPQVGQPTVSETGQRGVIGAAGPAGFQPPQSRGGLAGMTAQPPTQQKVSGPTTPTIERKDLEENPNAPLTPKGFVPTEPAPLFEEGKKAYTNDQALATQKLTALKPALLAVKMIPNLRSGPGTKTWNDAVAFFKTLPGFNGVDFNDPTAVYQEVNKYLSQYLKGRGGRSDADLMAAEESSPNPGKQINPALLKLTQTAIAQDRIEAARALNFGARNDYQNYGRYSSSFPALMDERAFSVDTMTPDQKKELAKELKKMSPNQLERFKNSLSVFDRTNVGGGQ